MNKLCHKMAFICLTCTCTQLTFTVFQMQRALRNTIESSTIVSRLHGEGQTQSFKVSYLFFDI